MNAMRRVTIAAVIVLLTLVSSSAQRQKPITGDTLAMLESWVNAVKTHTPGRADESVAAVAVYSYEIREELNAGMALFLGALKAKRIDTARNPAAQAIAALGRRVGEPFLKQAVVLHSDVAVYAERFPAPSGDVKTPPPARNSPIPGVLRRRDPIPPLLTQDRLSLVVDGQVLREVAASWNWPFARSLLDLVSLPDPFVGDWYHATTASMFADEQWGDATPHLSHAAEVVPNDPRVAFDRGCYAEVLGLPMHQALRPDPPSWTPRGPAPSLIIPLADKTNAEAERLYRRALSIDPTLVEARVRLARLLDLRKRHEEAAGELKTALSGSPSGVLSFYAHLFAGRTAQAMGRAGESSADPWWQYHLCSGRDADDLLRAVWASVPR